MTQKITEQDFQNIVSRPYRSNCKGVPVRQGKAEDGHGNCGSCCEGNYYVGGECNFGGRHKLSDDLVQINKNFEVFDVLANQQRKLSASTNEAEFNQKKKQLIDNFQLLKTNCQDGGSNFLYGGCLGIEQDKATFQGYVKDKLKDLAQQVQMYIERVEKTTFVDLRDFQEKWEKIESLGKEITKLANEAKQEKDPAKKKQLLALVKQKQAEQVNLQTAIKNSVGYALFSTETGNNLSNIVKNLINPNFRNRPIIFPNLPNPKQGNQSKNNTTNSWLSPQTKENLKSIGMFIVVLGGLLLVYWWVKSKFSNE